MKKRIELHQLLVELLRPFVSDETYPAEKRVYFQPPATIKMHYPCIRYSLAGDAPVYADNTRYAGMRRYTVMVIDRNPDSEIPDEVIKMPYCKLDRVYTADNLNHYTFDLYF